MTPPSARLPKPVAAILRTVLPLAERDEVIADLETEFRLRAAEDGPGPATRWAWRQALRSLPSLLGRGVWRGMTGFEPDANRMRPGGPMFESWIMDVRYAGRRLLRRPTYAILAVLTLALGAGGTAAIYSVVRTLLLDPLPIVEEDKVGALWFESSWTEEEFLTFRTEFPGFQKMAAYRSNDQVLETPGAPLRLITGIAVSHEMFDVLGARPALGRTFQPGDDVPGAEMVAVLSHGLWQELGSDQAIVGSRLQLGGFTRTVVGVMPREFWFPAPATRIWTAAQLSPTGRSGNYTLVGRVSEGVEVEHMQGQLDSLAAALGRRFEYPDQWDKSKNASVMPMRDFLVGDVRPSLIATLAAMGVILLIACANVAAMMLGQVDSRSVELALRAALGANRQRLVQQLVLESLLIGVLAGVAGAGLAVVGFSVLVDSLPLGALADNATLDWTIFWASFLAALLSALLIAIVPGIALWRGSSLRATMSTTRTGGIAGRSRLEGGLVIAQMALAVLLAAGAGLLIRSVANLRAIDPGVDVEGLVVIDTTMPINLPQDQRLRVIADVLPSLQALSGVRDAAAAQKIPLRDSGDNWGIRVRGKPHLGGTTAFRMVTRDYLPTMGMEIRRGRSFDGSDRAESDRVVIINEALAAKYFAGEDPIGQVLLTGLGEGDADQGERIIGVVSDAAEANLTDDPVPTRYMLYEHLPFVWHQVSFVLRTDQADLAPAVMQGARSTLAREGSRLAVQNTATMQSLFELAVGPTGQIVTLLSLLAGLALVLGAIGVYGVISHYVTRRSRDYGICLALGERPARVIRQVVARGALLVAVGSAIGIVAALFLTKVLATLLYGVEATDPVAMGAAVAVLLTVGVVAAFIPARRASLMDPAVILRE